MFKHAGIIIPVIVGIIIANIVNSNDDVVRDSILYLGGYVMGFIVWRKG